MDGGGQEVIGVIQLRSHEEPESDEWPGREGLKAGLEAGHHRISQKAA